MLYVYPDGTVLETPVDYMSDDYFIVWDSTDHSYLLTVAHFGNSEQQADVWKHITDHFENYI